MSVSTIRDMKADLKTRFNADADLVTESGQRIQVSRGNPHPTRSEEEQILIGPVTQTELPAGLGNNGIEETYTIDIIISVQRPVRELYETLEDRAFVIGGHIEESMVDWRSESPVFNGLEGWIQVSAIETQESLLTNEAGTQVTGREASLAITFSVVARK